MRVARLLFCGIVRMNVYLCCMQQSGRSDWEVNESAGTRVEEWWANCHHLRHSAESPEQEVDKHSITK